MVESRKRSQSTHDALVERGHDDLAHELRAAGEEEEQFRVGRHSPALGRVLEQVADRFAERRAARLARDERPCGRGRVRRFGEPLDLGRFADGFAAFEGDEYEERRDMWRMELTD